MTDKPVIHSRPDPFRASAQKAADKAEYGDMPDYAVDPFLWDRTMHARMTGIFQSRNIRMQVVIKAMIREIENEADLVHKRGNVRFYLARLNARLRVHRKQAKRREQETLNKTELARLTKKARAGDLLETDYEWILRECITRRNTPNYAEAEGRIDALIRERKESMVTKTTAPESVDSELLKNLLTKFIADNQIPISEEALEVLKYEALGSDETDFEGTTGKAMDLIRPKLEALKAPSTLDETFGPKGGNGTKGLTKEVREAFFPWAKEQMTQVKADAKWFEQARDMTALRLSNGATDSFTELPASTTLDALKTAWDHVMHLFTKPTKEGLEAFLMEHRDPKGEKVLAALSWKLGKPISRFSEAGIVLYEAREILDAYQEHLHQETEAKATEAREEKRKVETNLESKVPEPAQNKPVHAVTGEIMVESLPSKSAESSAEVIVFDPVRAISHVKAASALVNQMYMDKVLISEVDYGPVPGTDKPTLLKPGAEKLLTAFQLFDKFTRETVERNWKEGFFFYEYECTLYDRETGKAIGSGIGNCNSMEKKYRYRWVSKDRIPANLNPSDLPTKGGKLSEPEFAIDKAETTGKYGKPVAYWQQFKDAMASGTAVKGSRKSRDGKEMVTWEIDATLYGIPNDDVFDLVNTISKMAQKRALVAATLNATGASAVFTQDMEDFSDFGMFERTA